ncbi:MAG: TPM domain-containing protein [Bacteroidetes bacterium]|nr:TPM domain-containing protein [Bacteroidota bacterium]
MSVSAKEFFNPLQQEEIKQAIIQAELETSGEIRVHIENTCKEDVLDRSAYLFHKLKMNKTQLRNGVLVYLAVRHRKFAIIGDKGIHQVVPENFWDDIKEKMLGHFGKGEFTEGLCYAIKKAGEQLKQYFPRQSDDVNELPDDISFGK